MNVKAFLDLLMLRLGNRTAPGLRAACLKEAAQIQQDLEGGETLYWFLISEEAETLTVPGERRIALPSDFIREVDEHPLVNLKLGAEDIKIHKGSYDEARRAFSDEATGPPEVWTIRGSYILLFPAPDVEYTVSLPGYYAKQELPIDSEASENPWYKHASDYLLAATGLKIAAHHLKDPELVQVFESDRKIAQRRLFISEIAREEANRSRSMDED